MKYIKRKITIIVLIFLLLLQTTYGQIFIVKSFADETTPTPTPTASASTGTDPAPTPPPSPTPPQSPITTPTPTPTQSQSQNNSVTPTPTPTSTVSYPNSVSRATGSDPSNTNNGSGSTNTSTENAANSSTTDQNNTAQIGNDVNQNAITGNNTASANVGTTSLSTSNANASGTLVTSGNDNVQGIAVAEFNINDNQTGDLVLGDFASHCIFGCTPGDLVSNTGNGADSTNSANLSSANQSNTFENNDATVGNSLTLHADSGNNTASMNTGGNTTLQTGNANVDGNILSFLNNNIAGQVLVNVVNIFGNLVGDIILPADESCTTCSQGTTVTNTGNGANSTNDASSSSTNSDNTTQANTANIANNLDLSATTGNNSTTGNTGGDSSVQAGTAHVKTNVLNVTNNNIENGGTWWLVLINNAGTWIGELLGFPGSNIAASSGTQLSTSPSGDTTATNTENGANSTNNSSLANTNTSATTQQNNANLRNTLHLSANTGGNQANYNTGGNTQIRTGDANVIANLINFVNNNIKGKGKLIVTIVNVFGSWIGDMVTPGQHKQNKSNTSQQANVQHTANNTNNQKTASSQNSQETQVKSSNIQLVQGTHTTTISNNTTNRERGTGTINAPQISTNLDGTSITFTSAPKAEIAGASTQKKKVTINLAYLIFLLPLGAAFMTIKKRKLLGRYT